MLVLSRHRDETVMIGEDIELMTLYGFDEDGSRQISAHSRAFEGRRPPDALPDASMSLTLVVENRLWGLVTCHDRSPSVPSRRACALCDLVAEVAAIQVESIRRGARCEVGRSVGHWRARLSAQMARGRSLDEAICREGRELLTLMGATGLAVLHRDERQVLGETPAGSALDELADRLTGSAPTEMSFVLNLRPGHSPFGGLGMRAAGVCLVPLAPTSDRFLVFFRSASRRDDPPACDHGPDVAPWTERQRWLASGLRFVALEALGTDPQETVALASEHEARQTLLDAALDCRKRDVLALIREMLIPFIPDPSIEGHTESVLATRVDTLAGAYEQLADSDVRVGSLADVIRAEVAAAGVGMEEHLVVSGVDVGLNGDALAMMTMVVHELVRDAGCAATSDGVCAALEVAIESVDDSIVDVLWRETVAEDGARIERDGSGAAIIERAVRIGLGGTVSDHRAVGGRVVRIGLPARHVAFLRPGLLEDPAQELVHRAALADRTVFIAEDDALHAVNLETALRRRGLRASKPVGSLEQAVRSIEAAFPGCAVLDVHLGHENTFGLADRLQAAGVPFLFVAGHGEGALIPARFDGVPVLAKPVRDEMLGRALMGVLSAAAA